MWSVIVVYGKFRKRKLTNVTCRGEGMDQISHQDPSSE
jgi:hypothetical protein